MPDLDTTNTTTKKEAAMTNQPKESALTTMLNRIRFIAGILGFMLPYTLRLFRLRISAIQHTWTYKPVDSPQNIVIIGGSFAGTQVAKMLADSVPTGYRVILVEKNSHFNYLFAFPRFSVVNGYEQDAFIPYEEILRSGIKKGSLMHVHAEAVQVTDGQVLLSDGETLDYAYLIIATGSSQLPPAKMISVERDGACDELRSVQHAIAQSDRIAVLGSGAVGVEIASDIKSYFPKKEVTLFSSRSAVMPSFGPKLQIHVAGILQKLGVTLRYNTRAKTLENGKEIALEDGQPERFDLVLSCIGQTPNSSLLRSFLPESVSKQTGRILVKPTLQIQLADKAAVRNIFALGDVAEHGGPRMARAVYMQAGIVRNNVMDLIRGRPASCPYVLQRRIEGCIQLTVGKDESLTYIPGEDGRDMLLPGRGYPEDFRIAMGWRLVGAKYPGRLSARQKLVSESSEK